VPAAERAAAQGLALVHWSAQRKHFLRELLLTFSDRNGSG
jgi:hypothetical protein